LVSKLYLICSALLLLGPSQVFQVAVVPEVSPVSEYSENFCSFHPAVSFEGSTTSVEHQTEDDTRITNVIAQIIIFTQHPGISYSFLMGKVDVIAVFQRVLVALALFISRD